MGKLKDKYNNWKNHKYDKFRDQSQSSLNETKKEAKEIYDCYSNEKTLNTFAFEFRRPWHKKAIPILKSIHLKSFFAFGILIVLLFVFYGLFKNLNFGDYTYLSPSAMESQNQSIWLGMFLSFAIPSILFIFYIFPSLFLTYKRDKKFKDSEIYKYRFQKNLVINIILIVCFFFIFINFKNFGFNPIQALMYIPYNNPFGSTLIIIYFVFNVITFLVYLLYTVTFIMCYACQPKFNMEKLTNKEK